MHAFTHLHILTTFLFHHASTSFHVIDLVDITYSVLLYDIMLSSCSSCSIITLSILRSLCITPFFAATLLLSGRRPFSRHRTLIIPSSRITHCYLLHFTFYILFSSSCNDLVGRFLVGFLSWFLLGFSTIQIILGWIHQEIGEVKCIRCILLECFTRYNTDIKLLENTQLGFPV